MHVSFAPSPHALSPASARVLVKQKLNGARVGIAGASADAGPQQASELGCGRFKCSSPTRKRRKRCVAPRPAQVKRCLHAAWTVKHIFCKSHATPAVRTNPSSGFATNALVTSTCKNYRHWSGRLGKLQRHSLFVYRLQLAAQVEAKPTKAFRIILASRACGSAPLSAPPSLTSPSALYPVLGAQVHSAPSGPVRKQKALDWESIFLYPGSALRAKSENMRIPQDLPSQRRPRSSYRGSEAPAPSATRRHGAPPASGRSLTPWRRGSKSQTKARLHLARAGFWLHSAFRLPRPEAKGNEGCSGHGRSKMTIRVGGGEGFMWTKLKPSVSFPSVATSACVSCWCIP